MVADNMKNFVYQTPKMRVDSEFYESNEWWRNKVSLKALAFFVIMDVTAYFLVTYFPVTDNHKDVDDINPQEIHASAEMSGSVIGQQDEVIANPYEY